MVAGTMCVDLTRGVFSCPILLHRCHEFQSVDYIEGAGGSRVTRAHQASSDKYPEQ